MQGKIKNVKKLIQLGLGGSMLDGDNVSQTCYVPTEAKFGLFPLSLLDIEKILILLLDLVINLCSTIYL